MTLDVRRPLGWLFLLLGLILTAYGWLSTHVGGSQPHSNDYLNGLWGGIFVLFGLVVLWISRRPPTR